MAGLPFPPNWPMFTPKDKLGDWFEAYASIMELNVWLNTILKSASYDEKTRLWNVEITRGDSQPRNLHPCHVVFCTGQAGEALNPTFPGQDVFKGHVYHGSEHKDASILGDVEGKKVVVVGSGNSGHDISQNYYESGAEVLMLQRRGTYVVTAKTGLFMLHEGLYEEDGTPVEDADIYGQSMPTPVQFAMNVTGIKRIWAAERETLDDLERQCFKLDFGPDGRGIYRKHITRGGGYYIDVGCSQLIIDGKVKVPEELRSFLRMGLYWLMEVN
jgi:cation diffusion facilitator CzcD-associated flavoprotein CzcO